MSAAGDWILESGAEIEIPINIQAPFKEPKVVK